MMSIPQGRAHVLPEDGAGAAVGRLHREPHTLRGRRWTLSSCALADGHVVAALQCSWHLMVDNYVPESNGCYIQPAGFIRECINRSCTSLQILRGDGSDSYYRGKMFLGTDGAPITFSVRDSKV